MIIAAPFLTSHRADAQFTRFQAYTDEQGLSTLDVKAFAQDKAGRLLVGTGGGLYEYDGIHFTPYTAPGLPTASPIRQIAFDADDRLWVITAGRAFMQDGATFRAIDTGGRPLDDESHHLLVLNKRDAVIDAGGVLLRIPLAPSTAGTPARLFDAGTREKVAGLATARFVVPAGEDELLIGCGRILCISSHGHVTTLGKLAGLPDDDWCMALEAPDGVLWVRSVRQLAWRNPGEASFHAVEVPGISQSYFASHLEQLDLVSDGQGGILTEGDGDLLGFRGGSWSEYGPHPGGLPANVVHGLFIDHEGSLWVGSEGGGAFRSLGFGAWEHWTADNGLPNNTVWSMTRPPGGQLWVATDRGAVSLGDQPGRIAGSDYALAATRQGRLWAAPFGGSLLRVDAQGRGRKSVAFAPVVLMAMVDRQDRLWLGTREGVFVVSNADAAISDIRPRLILPEPKTEVMTDPSGGMWAVGPGGVFRLRQDGSFQLVLSPAVVGSHPMDLAFAPDGSIWIGTDGIGIQRFRLEAGHLLFLNSIRSPVIASDSILFLHRDRFDRLWVGSDHGIDMLDGRSWRRFDSSQGPISNDMSQWSVFEDVDGSMWFGTSNGLSHLRTPDHLPPQAPLHPRITSVVLGERDLPLAPRIKATWTAAPLIVRFTDLDYAKGPIGFRYRLRGLDAGWSETAAHEVRYANVPAGTFSFELVAVSDARRITSSSTGFTIRVSAPWWRRWWFFGLCSAFAALAVIAAWQGRVRFLLRRQRHLEDLVNLRTAEIEHARRELEHRSRLEQRRLEEMVSIRTAEIEQARSDLQRIAMSDVLTGLANRGAIMAALEHAVTSVTSSDGMLAILLCDIDHFKKINDQFGHLAGDAVLVEFGGRLGRAVSSPISVGRYGGEEFLVILSGDQDTIVRRILDVQTITSRLPYTFADEPRQVTFSGGVAFHRPEDTPIAIIGRADAALYAAKRRGRNRIVFDGTHGDGCDGERTIPLDELVGPCALDQAREIMPPVPATGAEPEDVPHRRRTLELDLRTALRDGQFLLHYQPIVNIDTDAVTSCEALLRWQSPSRGNVPPADFIPFAEEAGLMPEIGDWVLRTACQEARDWPDDLKISVNLSPLQLRLPDLVGRISEALEKTGLSPRRLELEVTETAMIDDMAAATRMLRDLRALGITIALDDFGTGYSSLSFLRTLPFDRVKIDRSFVQDLGVRPGAIAIVRAVTGLCSSLGAGVTAEGVETDRQIDLLREAGCLEIQGFRVGQPGPPAELKAWMTAFAASGRHPSLQ